VPQKSKPNEMKVITNPTPFVLIFFYSIIHSNLCSVGIVIGNDKSGIDESLVNLRKSIENIAYRNINSKSLFSDKK
jgi:hypothetical protein